MSNNNNLIDTFNGVSDIKSKIIKTCDDPSKTFDDEGNDQLFTFKLNSTGRTHLANGVHGPFSVYEDRIMFRFFRKTKIIWFSTFVFNRHWNIKI